MPQNIVITPKSSFKKEKLKFKDIPVNQYNKKIKDVLKEFTKEELLGIYLDMQYIREFETSLDLIKKEGIYQGMQYDHKGPAHLSLGQEASAVGQAFYLNENDHIYGSHRSHGEILAKGFSAVNKLEESTLMEIMESFFGGQILKIVEKNHKGNVKDLGRKFLIYGAYAEIFARYTGFNKGLSGSMHAFFTPFGIYPNNAIVGGSATISAGAALFKRVNRKEGIIVCNIGDASFGCGPVWEAMMFSAMDQYRKLWDSSLGGGLPIIFNAFNNQYGMGGQTNGETMGYEKLVRIGAGVNPDQMHAERVNGYSPLAVMDALKRKKKILKQGKGPVLLDVITYRISGHSPSDVNSYRTKEELESWKGVDAIETYGKQLIEAGLATPADLKKINKRITNETKELFRLSTDLDISPRMTLASEEIGDVMFSNQSQERMAEGKIEMQTPLEENVRVKQIARKVRKSVENGKAVSKLKRFNIRDGIFEAIYDRYSKDPTLVAFGEENRDWGGAFGVYRGLTEALPYHKIFNSSISEAAIVGAAVGYGLEGGRVIAELMYCDFMGRAGDEIFNQLSKWQAMSGGILKMPVVLRVSIGAKYGAQHSQDWTTLISHIPGLKAVYPVTPYDAKGLMNTALNGTDPVVFFESQGIYDVGEDFVEEGVPEGYYEIPFGEPAIRKKGNDISIISLGSALYGALKAADQLKEKYGIDAEVIDLRSINPLNYDMLVSSLEKTGRGLLISDACERGSYLHTIANNLSQLAFDYLDAPIAVVGSRNWITPAPELEEMFFPQENWILDTIHEKIIPLENHNPTSNQTNGELLRRNRLGI